MTAKGMRVGLIFLFSLKVRIPLVGILNRKFLEENLVQGPTSARFQQEVI